MSSLNSISEHSSLVMLNASELEQLEGGSFAAAWYDAVFCVSAGIHGLYDWAQMAGDYQSSLPACDKK